MADQVQTGAIHSPNISGATNASYTVTGAKYQYDRPGVSCHHQQPSVRRGVTSANATLTVSNNASIVCNPSTVRYAKEANSSFNAGATGTGYQWQVSTGWWRHLTDISGANSPNTEPQCSYGFHEWKPVPPGGIRMFSNPGHFKCRGTLR